MNTKIQGWREKGEKDPHAGKYDGTRESLSLGQYTDDMIANGAFLNYDVPIQFELLLSKSPDYHTPIAWMTAAKDRIRWLSRRLAPYEAVENLRESLPGYQGGWGEHPDHPRAAWQQEVSEGGTQLGYWEWTVSQIEQANDEGSK